MGTGAVGKSSVVLRLITDIFHDSYDPTIEDFYRKEIRISEEETVSCDVVDTAGQENYSHLRDGWVTDGEGFVLIYDISNKQSLECVKDLREYMSTIKDMEKIPVVVVGNKCDLPDSPNADSKLYRQISKEQGKEVADKLNCHFMEVSAKDNINITECFTLVAREMKENAPPPKSKKGFCTIL